MLDASTGTICKLAWYSLYFFWFYLGGDVVPVEGAEYRLHPCQATVGGNQMLGAELGYR